MSYATNAPLPQGAETKLLSFTSVDFTKTSLNHFKTIICSSQNGISESFSGDILLFLVPIVKNLMIQCTIIFMFLPFWLNLSRSGKTHIKKCIFSGRTTKGVGGGG